MSTLTIDGREFTFAAPVYGPNGKAVASAIDLAVSPRVLAVAFRLCASPPPSWQEAEDLLADPKARRDVLAALLSVLPVPREKHCP